MTDHSHAAKPDGAAQEGTWGAQVDAIVRGVAGGMLFGIPLLYTQEVWWVGSYSRPPQLLAALLFTSVPVFLLNRTAGFRTSKDVSSAEAFVDTVIALAIGLVSALFVLVLLREITTATSLLEALGKTVYEAVPFSLGVSVARHFLQGDREEEDDDNGGVGETGLDPTLKDLGATAIGAMFIAFNIAPTDEVPTLAAATSPAWLLVMVAASLLVSYGIVFEAGFAKSKRRHRQEGLLQQPLTETVFCYVVALAAAAVMLLFFQNLDVGSPPGEWLRLTLILGLPATVGGAAGRLAV